MEISEGEPTLKIDKKKEITDCLSSGRFVSMLGDITESKAPAWEAKIEELLQSPDPIVLVVNTYGGDISAAWAATGALMEGSFEGNGQERKKIRRVYTLAVKDCRSAGVEALMLGVQLDGAFATPDTIIQFHGSATPEEFPDVKARERRTKINDNLIFYPVINMLSAKTGIPFETLQQNVRENVAYTAQQAKKIGIIEDIYDGPIPKSLLIKE